MYDLCIRVFAFAMQLNAMIGRVDHDLQEVRDVQQCAHAHDMVDITSNSLWGGVGDRGEVCLYIGLALNTCGLRLG